MGKKVYIQNAVFIKERNDLIDMKDNSIDEIGLMCISIINKLLSNVNPVNIDKNTPIFFGSAYSSLKSLHEFNCICEKSGALKVNPSLFPNTVLNSPSCRASIYHELTGPIYNISNGSDSALSALELASIYIRNGEVNYAIVCSAEEKSLFAEKIEKKILNNHCGALILTSVKSKMEIIKFSRDKMVQTDDCEIIQIKDIPIIEKLTSLIGSTFEEKVILQCENGDEILVTLHNNVKEKMIHTE